MELKKEKKIMALEADLLHFLPAIESQAIARWSHPVRRQIVKTNSPVFDLLRKKLKESVTDDMKFTILTATEEYQIKVWMILSSRRVNHWREYSAKTTTKRKRHNDKRKKRHTCNYCKRDGFFDQADLMFRELMWTHNLSLGNHIEDMLIGSKRPNYEEMSQREGRMTETMAVNKLREIKELTEEEFKFATCLMEDYNFRELLECLKDDEFVDVVRIKMELDEK